jgi:hypothetical protein
MANFKKFVYLLLSVIFVIGGGVIVEKNYSYLFSRHVTGEIVDVQRVNSNLAVVGNGAAADAAMFSFAVAIRDEKGTIHTASTEDRQWAVAKQGFCADAIFYPYPPWDLQSAGTYQNARLIQLRDCPKGLGQTHSVESLAPAVAAPAVVQGQPSAGLPAATPSSAP